MANSSNSWEQANVRINGVEWVPGSAGVMYLDQPNKIEVDAPEAFVRTLRFDVADYPTPRPEANPAWGVDVERKDGKFTSLVTFVGNSTGSLKLIIYSRDAVSVLELLCEVKINQPSLRFWYGSNNQDAPLPPEVVDIRLDSWSRVNVRLKRSDGSPMANVPLTVYMPEKGTLSRTTSELGTVIGDAFQYNTIGPRTFEAVATLPGGDVSVQLLLNVREWPWP